jgi:hypothetical protein
VQRARVRVTERALRMPHTKRCARAARATGWEAACKGGASALPTCHAHTASDGARRRARP